MPKIPKALEEELSKELETYRSQKIIIDALMAFKESSTEESSTVTDLINRCYLRSELKSSEHDEVAITGNCLGIYSVYSM